MKPDTSLQGSQKQINAMSALQISGLVLSGGLPADNDYNDLVLWRMAELLKDFSSVPQVISTCHDGNSGILESVVLEENGRKYYCETQVSK